MKICTNYEDSRGNEVEKSTLTGTSEGMNIVAGACIWTDMDSPLKPVARGCVSMQIVKKTFWHEKCVFVDSFGFLLTEEKEQRHAVPGICEVIFWQLGEKKHARKVFFLGLFLQAQRKWLEKSCSVMFPCLRKRGRKNRP
jgi:hypothetical protein